MSRSEQSDSRIQVPPDTLRTLGSAMDALLAADRSLERAADLLLVYSPRMNVLAEHLAKQVEDLRNEVHSFREGCRI